MTSRIIVLLLALGTGLLGSCSKDPQPVPAISSFSPAIGPVATTVTISGSNFAAIPEGNEVRFNGIKAAVTASTASEIKVTVPPGATSGIISINVNGQTCVSGSSFTVNPLIGTWQFTGAAATNCDDPLEEGVVACSLDCPKLTFTTTSIIFANSATSYTFTYTLSTSHSLTITSGAGSFSPTYVITGDMLTLVYPPTECSLTETYEKI